MTAPAVAPPASSGDPRGSSEVVDGARPEVPRHLSWIAIVAVIAGTALRLWTRSPMWLDEALTANIAAAGLGDLVENLRRDGAPPLFYALLAVWTRVAGDGDAAVRLLSAVFSVATLPLAYRMGRRRGGAVAGIAVLVLVATSPFAFRYATEARMYSLVALLVSAGWLALANALEKPTVPWLAATGVCAGALLLTHYWGFYLVGSAVVALVVVAWRGPPQRRASAVRAAIALVIGSVVLFAPWVPVFLYQAAHTGTPWGTPPGPVEVAFTTLVDFGGGPYPEGQTLAALLAALAVLALVGRALDSHRIEIDLRTRPGVRGDFLVAAAALLTGVGVGFATNSAFASRYTSVAFPLIVLVAGYGMVAFADRRIVAVALAGATVLGVAGGVRNTVTDRTQARQVEQAMVANGATAGDVVVYCPDQLGPDVHRVLPDGLVHYTFPDLADPRLVNWVDYAERMEAADPAVFAADVLERAEGRDIFYVWMPGYRSLDKRCERVNDALGNARPGNRQLLDPDDDYFERQALWLHPAGER